MKIDNDFFRIDKITSGMAQEYTLPTDKIVRKGTLKNGIYTMTEYKLVLKTPGKLAALALLATAMITVSKVFLK